MRPLHNGVPTSIPSLRNHFSFGHKEHLRATQLNEHPSASSLGLSLICPALSAADTATPCWVAIIVTRCGALLFMPRRNMYVELVV